MTSINIETKNIEFNGTKLRIFDKIGFNSGENWVINAFSGCFVEVDPSPVSPLISGLINTDVSAGNIDKINHISLAPSQLLCLYLEGALPIRSIMRAEDHDSWVVFPEVPFNTSRGVMDLPVRVSEEYSMATIDENGEIV